MAGAFLVGAAFFTGAGCVDDGAPAAVASPLSWEAAPGAARRAERGVSRVTTSSSRNSTSSTRSPSRANCRWTSCWIVATSCSLELRPRSTSACTVFSASLRRTIPLRTSSLTSFSAFDCDISVRCIPASSSRVMSGFAGMTSCYLATSGGPLQVFSLSNRADGPRSRAGRHHRGPGGGRPHRQATSHPTRRGRTGSRASRRTTHRCRDDHPP